MIDGLQYLNITDLPNITLKDMLYNEKTYQKKRQNDIEKMATHFPNMLDFMDSVKATFFLHYTYRFNITLAVLDGYLSIENHFNYAKIYQVFELHLQSSHLQRESGDSDSNSTIFGNRNQNH